MALTLVNIDSLSNEVVSLVKDEDYVLVRTTVNGQRVDCKISVANFLSGLSETSFKWSSAENYNNGEIREYGGKWWESKITDGVTPNIGNFPTEGTYWTEVSPANESSIRAYAAGVYKSDLVVVHYTPENKLYYLDASVPRPFNSTDFATEKAAGKWKSYSLGNAADIVFAPSSANWTTDPANVHDALEELAASKADKITGGTSGNLVERDANGNIVDAGVSKEQLFEVSDVDVSDIAEGQYKIPLVQKSGGVPVIQGSSQLIDKLASSTVLAMLGDNANWGNVPGKSGDFIKLTGDNSLGQLGENSQELYDNEGQYFLCVSHILDVAGEAVWVRNRSRDSLRIGVTQDDAVIAAIENETDWNTTTNTKIITTRSKPGSWHKSDVTGYLYHCYKEADSNADGIPDQWYWYRSGLPATESMQILNTGDYTGLVTALGEHDWSTGAYDPSGLTGEKGTQGQEYYDVANRKLYKCVFDAVNAKLVWEQINLVKA